MTRPAPEMPARIAKLRRDPARPQFPVPWFVAWVDGKPEFRVIGPGRIEAAVREARCWICGRQIHDTRAAFVVGPMCAVNRTSAEPPSHRDCAIYAAQACPFLTRPHMRRREAGLPEEATNPAGIAITRNPGVALVWVTRLPARARRDADGGLLFDIGEPTEALWFAEGRSAMRAEVEASIESGLPILREYAELDGPEALHELERRHATALELLPEAVA